MKKIVSIILVSVLMFSMIGFIDSSALVLAFYVRYTRTTTSVNFKWTDFNNSCEFHDYDITTYYNVYRKRATKNAKYKLVCENTTSLSFRDENLKSNRKYKYVVKAFVYDENNKLLKSFTEKLEVKTKKPTDYKNPKKYIQHMTKNEKFKLIEKDFTNNLKIPKNSKLKEFKITNYYTDYYNKKPKGKYYGFKAKIELTKKGYNNLYKTFRKLYEDDKHNYYFENVFGKEFKYATKFYQAFRSGQLSKSAYIMTVTTSGVLAIIDGKYYLLVDSSFSTATEYFSKNYPNSYK